MGRLKEESETIWSEPTNRTIYQWTAVSRAKTKEGTHTTKTSVWTNTVRNRMRQKAGEIEVSGARNRGSKMVQGAHPTERKRPGCDHITEKDKGYWKIGIVGETAKPSIENATTPGKGKEPTKTAHSCYTIRDQ